MRTKFVVTFVVEKTVGPGEDLPVEVGYEHHMVISPRPIKRGERVVARVRGGELFRAGTPRAMLVLHLE
jgi:hypothetical protein